MTFSLLEMSIAHIFANFRRNLILQSQCIIQRYTPYFPYFFLIIFATWAEKPVLWAKGSDFRHDFADRIALYVN